MNKVTRPKETTNQQALEDVKKIVDQFVRENPRLEFADSEDMDDVNEAAAKEQDLADIYRKHLGLLGSN